MSRTRAQALVLVNWNGVFYERYLLDRHVTALEGTNGAGKTTVMIAAYAVLLPDMSRLRFTNVGETGATGGDKGIWGRLGESGRPSYAAIDFAIAGRDRLVAGVHLERKGEPSVEPTPFIVWGLADDVRLQDLLLVTQGDTEAVPELPELREGAARLGGRLQVFSSARDYFAALFDRGVIPLRLSTDEERNKLNEMLRTSMTGGISRALTSELRAFLLKEESGLADTLQRMKANLDACRRTRIEVQESRRLEREIGDVFHAGNTMFAAAVLATRERADELERRVAEAEAARTTAVEAQKAAENALARTTDEIGSIDARRRAIDGALDAARRWHTRLSEALAAANDVRHYLTQLNTANEQTVRAAGARARADQLRLRLRAELSRCQEDYQRAARGLADMQRGLEELHRRAGAYHQAIRRLREAERLLSVPPLTVGELELHRVRAQADLEAVDRERREASIRLSDAQEHRRRHGEVLSALKSLVSGEVPIGDATRVAVEALRRYRDQVALAGRVSSLAAELAEARRLAERQAFARARAQKLGIVLSEEPAGVVIYSLLDGLEAERGDHDEAERKALNELTNAQRVLNDLEAQQRQLADSEPEWREHQARAARLCGHVDFPVVDRASLERARTAVGESLTLVRRAEETTYERQEVLVRDARELIAAGGSFAPELLRLKDLLGAEAVAGSFEDAALSEAGRLEACLGPLTQALVVDDPLAAARAIAGRAVALPDVWLLPRDADLEELGSAVAQAEEGSPDVIVDEGRALRVSRIPARPRLGRRAREARAGELRAEAETKARELEALRAKRRRIERLLLDADALLGGHLIWLAADPTEQLAQVRRKLADTKTHIEASRGAAGQHSEASRMLRPRIDALRHLLSEALLLDPPDYAERVRLLEREHETACAAQAEVFRVSRFADTVDTNLVTLRTLPLSEDEATALQLRVDDLRRERERLDGVVDAIVYVHANAEALTWSEAPGRLAESQALVPAIEAQLREAETAQADAQEAADSAEDSYEATNSSWQDADGRRRVATQAHDAAVKRFESFGIAAPSKDAVRLAREEIDRLESELNSANIRRDELLTARGSQEMAQQKARELAEVLETKLGSERREAEPAVARWERLREQAIKYGLFESVLSAGQTNLSDMRGHVNLVQQAQSHRMLLFDRLRGAQGGATLLTEIEVLRDTSDADFGEGVLELWLTVRDWLRRRLPAQVAEVDDPREGLLRLRDQLLSLEERLSRQESDLRGASEDVARGIEVQIRKARGQVNRLTKNLEGVSFGGIHGIRVRLTSVERMEQILNALREGSAQGILFQQDLPIEEALGEIFRRYGGGRTGGQRLLDYREYVHLQVEIRRKTGTDWEIANPTRLSTGEAIGVGAALMMVVLTEWERDSTLLRGKRSHGSLRFLFLDEANRLSQDNLGVLFDLCQTLDLQLLIAAPEVARAEGNTTYRLVRRTTSDGREEVLVSGRRTRVEA
ncbi:MAG: chromosome partition protein MukB [Hyphomonadaceae bacterium]|nr:chromosome partition protein MukB [Hyphomonadaceae bacterium]